MEKEIVRKIESLCFVKSKFDGEKCVALDFTDENNPYLGTIRHNQNKIEILNLIDKLKNLKYLNLRKNRIVKSFHLELPELEHLDLGSNYLLTIPPWIQNLNLKFLNLGVNNLTFIPEWFVEKKFETLKLHKNLISYLPEINTQNLIFLNLYQNNMKKIPNFIWYAKKLEFFSWGNSEVFDLPAEIGNLSNLIWLSFVCNKISFIPEEFCNLSKLRGARFTKNNIEYLPKNIENLKNLEEMLLFKNKIKEIPTYLSAIIKL